MNAVLVLLLALATARPSALAQDVQEPSPPAEVAATSEAPVRSKPTIDGRAYWARFDAEQAARQARLDTVDVRTPKIVTLSLAVPAAALLISLPFTLLAQGSGVVITELLPGEGGDAPREHPGPQPSPVNYWLLGVGGALALGAIGAGIWWRKRAIEYRRVKTQLDAASNGASQRGPVFRLQASGDGVGLWLRGRL